MLGKMFGNPIVEGLVSIFGGFAESSMRSGDMPNIPFPTMGGPLGWNTLSSANGYRLQQNMATTHARILNSNDVRVAWGSIDAMRRKFSELTSSCSPAVYGGYGGGSGYGYNSGYNSPVQPLWFDEPVSREPDYISTEDISTELVNILSRIL